MAQNTAKKQKFGGLCLFSGRTQNSASTDTRVEQLVHYMGSGASKIEILIKIVRDNRKGHRFFQKNLK